MSTPTWIDADEVLRRVSADRARRLLRAALEGGLDPALDPPRSSPEAGAGQLLLMPSSTATSAGVKVLSVAPANPGRGLPRIQAWYVLMDAETLTPSVLLDGTALTALRTPATSALAAETLAPDEVDELVLIGGGPQARGHAEAMSAIRRIGHVSVADVEQDRAENCAGQVRELGLDCDAVTSPEEVEAAVRQAGIIVCATSSAEPVIKGEWVADGACVVAIGSHEPDRRELDAALLGRAQVVVEDVATALREAGDVIMAIEEGSLTEKDLYVLRDVVLGQVERATDRPNVVKTVGMSWQDLVVAEGAVSEGE
ncbi:ornithine cyclodeaminase family protein [Austwickia chelonae]|uniref:ornithine cyclodeaminase family protein n=1 Tax=Austwickia chelonae TaxID=100225 RepID=UPI000E22126F|nr:ornithine cyclodeaminase family protein [Austwickia chelonae]